MYPHPSVFVLMGVAATGKSTLGKALAKATDGRFFDGDDFHPEANREKMSKAIALDDSDRQAWLKVLSDLIAKQAQQPTPTFIACSALKKSYRKTLRSRYPQLQFIFLTTDPELLRQRITERHESGQHFMPPALLDSQLTTLEPPTDALKLDSSKSISELVSSAKEAYPLLFGY